MASQMAMPKNSCSAVETTTSIEETQEIMLKNKLKQIHCQSDKSRVDKIFKDVPHPITMEYYYKVIMNPMQDACSSIKRIGKGHWVVGGFDGHKYVCMDDLVNEPCVVFSFGIAQETSFEREINSLGCIVYGYDHTISKQARERQENKGNGFYIYGKGIDIKPSNKMTTLDHELDKLGLRNKTITYIKMDIEGSEVTVVPEWIKSGLLKNVKQIGMEFHKVDVKKVQSYWDIVEGLYEQGFRLMTFEPNYAMASIKGDEKIGNVHILHEVTFRKADFSC